MREKRNGIGAANLLSFIGSYLKISLLPVPVELSCPLHFQVLFWSSRGERKKATTIKILWQIQIEKKSACCRSAHLKWALRRNKTFPYNLITFSVKPERSKPVLKVSSFNHHVTRLSMAQVSFNNKNNNKILKRCSLFSLVLTHTQRKRGVVADGVGWGIQFLPKK